MTVIDMKIIISKKSPEQIFDDISDSRIYMLMHNINGVTTQGGVPWTCWHHCFGFHCCRHRDHHIHLLPLHLFSSYFSHRCHLFSRISLLPITALLVLSSPFTIFLKKVIAQKSFMYYSSSRFGISFQTDFRGQNVHIVPISKWCSHLSSVKNCGFLFAPRGWF